MDDGETTPRPDDLTAADFDALLAQPVVYGEWRAVVGVNDWIHAHEYDDPIPYPATVRFLLAGLRRLAPAGDAARAHALTMYGERARVLFPNLFPQPAPGPKYLMGIPIVPAGAAFMLKGEQ